MKDYEMWKLFGKTGEYDSYGFGIEESTMDNLANLVLNNRKKATSSLYLIYELEGEELPKINTYSIILNSKDEAVCIVKDINVYLKRFCDISEEYAKLEGEGDLSLEYWRKVHIEFFEEELREHNMHFDENMLIVCEEFEKVYPKGEHNEV